MKRWLSLIKRHVVPGTWTKPAKKRRPITVLPAFGSQDIFYMPVDAVSIPRTPSPPFVPTAPLVPRKSPPLCDTNLILENYRNRPSLTRASSQVLPLEDCDIPRDAYRDYAFIRFEPTYTVTVRECSPYQIVLQKPRPESVGHRIVSFFKENLHGKVRPGTAVYPPQ